MIQHRTMDNGLEVFIEPMSGVKSCGMTWMVPAGSGTDPGDRQGRSAMWAELVCRGAGDLGSREHADALDRAGVSRSVDTGSRYITLSAALLGERFEHAFPLLSDMVVRPRMALESVNPSRELCLQSLESLKDDPQERAVLAARERHHPSPLNRSGMGDESGLRALTQEELIGGWSGLARPRGSILSIAGAVEAEAVFSMLDTRLGGWTGAAEVVGPETPSNRGYEHEVEASNQSQIVVVLDGPNASDPEAVKERLAISVLGGGMSSRLFSEVREKRGLCYAVSAGFRADRETGTVTAYVGTTPERAQESLDVLFGEFERLSSPEGAITRDEFDRAVVGMKSNLVFGGESTGARAAAMAGDWFRLGRTRTLEERTAEVDALTLDAVNSRLLGRSLGRVTVQTLGPEALEPPAGALA